MNVLPHSEKVALIQERFALRGGHVVRTTSDRPVATRKEAGGYTIVQVAQGFGWRYRELLHRIVFCLEHGYLPTTVDHQDRHGDNNSGSNLRAASRSQQQWNRQTRKLSGLPRGVTRSVSRRNPFEAQARGAGGKHTFLGMFKTAAEASAVVEAFLKDLHGEFYCLPPNEEPHG